MQGSQDRCIPERKISMGCRIPAMISGIRLPAAEVPARLLPVLILIGLPLGCGDGPEGPASRRSGSPARRRLPTREGAAATPVDRRRGERRNRALAGGIGVPSIAP
ncbi:hypothetical protein GCM10009565_48720 [Amycolatopsis albidoflavus]